VLGVLVGTDTVTAQGHSPRTGHAKNGDFYLAKNGDLHLATSEDFFMATDRPWNERPAERHDSCHEEREWAGPKCLQLKLASL
jgi:hypothetical protein